MCRTMSAEEDFQELVRLLRAHGASDRHIRTALHHSGCEDKATFALFLRLHLPPAEYANRDSVKEHMRSLLGVSGRRAQKLISALQVDGAHRHLLHDRGSYCVGI